MTTFLFIAYGAASTQMSASQSAEDLRIFSNPMFASTFPMQAMATGPLQKPPI